MKRKGFTLVELLAVIVILAVIALIGTPIILNVIEGSKKGAFKSSAYGVIEAAELYTIMNTEDFKDNGEIIFDCDGTSCKSSDGSSLNIKGEIPKSGKVIVTKENISVDLLSDGKYYASGTKENLEIEKDYKKLDKTESIIDATKLTITSTSSKIIVNIAENFAIDNESGIKEYKVILIDADKTEEKKLSNIGTVEFTGLTNNKEYKVKVIAVNGNDMETATDEKTITTKDINVPTCTVSPKGWAQSKTVTCTYESGYTNEYSIDGGSTWETYTSAVTFTSNGTLIARITDGTNYVSSSSYTVSGIDTTIPTEATFTYIKTSKSITVTASGKDPESGIIRYQFSKDNGSSWTSAQESNSYTFNDLNSGTYKVKVRVYNGTYVNGTSGNFKDSDSQDIATTTITTPTCTVSPTGWSTSKTVTCTYDSGYTNEYSLDGGSTWKTYSSAVTFTSNGTLIARVNDGKNYVSSSSYTVSQIDTTSPTVTLGTSSSTSNSITIPYTLSDTESGIASYTCKYGTSSGSYTTTGSSVTSTSCKLTGLTHNKTYYYQVCATDNAGNTTTCKTGSKATSAISAPTCTVSPSGWSTSKSVTCTYPSGYTNQYSTDGGSTWKTYSSAVSFTSNGTLIARATDGTNYVSSSSYTISQIDRTSPTVTLGSVTSTSSTMTIPYTLSDTESGVKSYTCKYGTNSGSYTTTGSSVTSTSCKLTGLTHNKTYYYQVCATDNAGNTTTCKTGSKATSAISAPTCTVSPSGWSTSKSVTCTYPSGYTNQYSTDGGSTWKTYSSAVSFTSNGTLIARATDGTNYVSSSSYTISQIDRTAPTISKGTIMVTSRSITIPYTLSDTESGVKSYTCKYGTSSGSYTTAGSSVTSTSCSISGLSHNTRYYYQICATDNAGNNSTCKTGSVTTSEISAPTCTVSPSGWSTSKTVTCTYESAYTKQYSTDGGSTWKTYSGAVTFTSNGTLIARSTDGTNYVSSSSYTISQIDRTSASISINSVSTTDTTATINYTLSDSESGVGSYTCKYANVVSTASGTTTSTYVSAPSVSSTSCSITGLVSGKTYSYSVCVTDNAGNQTICSNSTFKTCLSGSGSLNKSSSYLYCPGYAVTNYGQSNYNTGSYQYMNWHVMEDNGSTIKLLADYDTITSVRQYDDDSNSWYNSEIRTWLNSTWLNSTTLSTSELDWVDSYADRIGLITYNEYSTLKSKVGSASWLYNSSMGWWYTRDAGSASNKVYAVTSAGDLNPLMEVIDPQHVRPVIIVKRS